MPAIDVAVIDYGVGNLLSVRRGLEHCGATVTVTADCTEILAAQRVVLPGVGAFGNAMQELRRLKLVGVLREVAERRTPLLGICLGMQLLFDESDELAVTTGLGLIPGRVVSIPPIAASGELQKIPHIGWNELRVPVSASGWQDTLLEDVAPGDAVYFVHSFMAVPVDPSARLADCVYGGHAVSAVVRHDRITGCQFHPEKSGEIGLRILRTFLR